MTRPPALPPIPPVLLALAAVSALFEIAFTLAESPLLGLSSLRGQAMMHAAVWPGLLGDWEPLFPGQALTMLFTHAFVHAGFLHMAFNMLLLLHLGREAGHRLGHAGLVLLLALSAIGGALAYVLLGDGETPMVGASGVVFGLFGATIWWDIQRRRAAGVSIEPALRLILGLVLMNGLLWLLVSGMLAWQAHLGGFAAGMAMARFATPSLAHRARQPGGKH